MMRCGYCVGIKPNETRRPASTTVSRCPCCGQRVMALYRGACKASHRPRSHN